MSRSGSWPVRALPIVQWVVRFLFASTSICCVYSSWALLRIRTVAPKPAAVNLPALSCRLDFFPHFYTWDSQERAWVPEGARGREGRGFWVLCYFKCKSDADNKRKWIMSQNSVQHRPFSIPLPFPHPCVFFEGDPPLRWHSQHRCPFGALCECISHSLYCYRSAQQTNKSMTARLYCFGHKNIAFILLNSGTADQASQSNQLDPWGGPRPCLPAPMTEPSIARPR